MPSGGRTKSTQPVATAACGMVANFAVAASCANVTPPAALMASTPAEPSEPVPERITPMALLPHWSASGPQEPVDGHVRSRRLRAGGQLQRAVCDGQIDVCRYDVYMVGFHRHAIGRLTDRHGGGSRQNLGQHAVVIWIEMLNEDDGQARIGGQFGEQKLEDLQPARGGANANHWDDRPGCTVVFGRFGGEGVPLRPHSVPGRDNSGTLAFSSMTLSPRVWNLPTRAISRP